MEPRYLRVSVTGRCNLRCIYCRPEGPCETDAAGEFTPEEIYTLVRCAAAEGVRKVRFTGGEPLLRQDLEVVAAAVSSIPGIEQTTLTTNGIGLAQRARGLKQAGLDRVNISLDTLQRERFVAITGRDLLDEVLEGIETAADTFDAVKLNTVLLRGRNDDEVEALVRFAAARRLEVRFIERYPWVGASEPDNRVSAEEVKGRLSQIFGVLHPAPTSELSVEQRYVLPAAGGARVGLIASVSASPCALCRKLRFTASGQLRPCLFADWGIDLGPLLRAGDEPAVRSAIRRVAARKRGARCAPAPVVPEPVSNVGG